MSLVREVGGAVLRRAGRVAGRLQESTDTPVDVLDGEDRCLVVVDAPGATTSDITIRYREESLEVAIERFRGYREGFEMRFPGRPLSIDATVDLPGVDPGGATARLREDGTLQVTLPKA